MQSKAVMAHENVDERVNEQWFIFLFPLAKWSGIARSLAGFFHLAHHKKFPGRFSGRCLS